MILSKKDRQRCVELAERGLQFNEELRDANRGLFERFASTTDYFTVSLAIALTWTKHAQYRDEFFEMAVPILHGTDEITLEEVQPYRGRFGADGLATAMSGSREFRNAVMDMVPDFKTADPRAIQAFQARAQSRLKQLKDQGKCYGVGPWLFLGPFKIILTDLDRLWDNVHLDSILLPTGLEVRRGIRKLKKENSRLAADFDMQWLILDEGDLLGGIANDTLIHNLLSNIAREGDTRALHINGAFYLLGREGEK